MISDRDAPAQNKSNTTSTTASIYSALNDSGSNPRDLIQLMKRLNSQTMTSVDQLKEPQAKPFLDLLQMDSALTDQLAFLSQQKSDLVSETNKLTDAIADARKYTQGQ